MLSRDYKQFKGQGKENMIKGYGIVEAKKDSGKSGKETSRMLGPSKENMGQK